MDYCIMCGSCVSSLQQTLRNWYRERTLHKREFLFAKQILPISFLATSNTAALRSIHLDSSSLPDFGGIDVLAAGAKDRRIDESFAHIRHKYRADDRFWYVNTSRFADVRR